MKTKITAALISTLLATTGCSVADDLGRLALRKGGDAAKSLSRNPDDVSKTAALRADDVGKQLLRARKERAKEMVRQDVRQAILSGVNKDSTAELMKVAEKANQEQYEQTDVLLTRIELTAIVAGVTQQGLQDKEEN